MDAHPNHESPGPNPGWNDEPSREAVFEHLDDAIYTTDAEGWLTYYNAAASELWGYRPELGKTRWCGSWRIYRPDGTPLPLDQCPMAVALKQGREVRGVQAVLERPDGTLVPFAPYPTPLRDASGQVVAGSNVLVKLDRLAPPAVADLCADLCDDEPAAISPIDIAAAFDRDRLTGCLQWTLAALADIDLAYRLDCDRLVRWTGSGAEKERIRAVLDSRRLKQRQPLIELIGDIRDQAPPELVDLLRAAGPDTDLHEPIESVARAALR